MADATDSKSVILNGCVGSSPSSGIRKSLEKSCDFLEAFSFSLFSIWEPHGQHFGRYPLF